MKSSSAEPSPLRRPVRLLARLVSGAALATVAFSVLLVLTLADRTRLDDEGKALRREVMERAFYLTKIYAQVDMILDYTPAGDPARVSADIDALRLPLYAHMYRYFRPDNRQVFRNALAGSGSAARELSRHSDAMWDVYLRARSALDAAVSSDDAAVQQGTFGEARELLSRMLDRARRYNDWLFIVQSGLAAEIENDAIVARRRSRVFGAIGLATAVALVGGLVAWVLTARRRHEKLEEAHRTAEQANRAKDIFLATVSHELRTPLHGIFGLLELTRSEPLSDDQARYLSLVGSSATGLLTNVEGLLDLSAIEAGKLQIRPEPTVVEEALGAVVESARAVARDRGLAFRHVACLGSHPRMIDGPRVAQVVTNLLSNALKFTEAGSVALTVEESAREITVSVEDTGPGIGDEHRERIFGLFVQADEGFARVHGGIGIGLAITRRLVDAMGGTLTLESTPGVGSTFTARIPAPPAPPRPADGPSPGSHHHSAPEAAPSATVRILIAEDEAINRLALRATLERAGHEVTDACDGVEVFERLRTDSYDLCLMDVSMPGMSGLDVVRGIRREERDGNGDRARIVALTAHARPEDRAACLEAGFDDYLGKPFSAEALLALVARHAHGLRASGSLGARS